MRIRLPEVLTEHNITAYEVAKRSGGKVIPSTLYRLVRQRGRVRMFDGVLLETLCEILNVDPGALLERGGRKGRRSN